MYTRSWLSLLIKAFVVLLLLAATVFSIISLATHSWNAGGGNNFGPFGLHVCAAGTV